MDEILQLIRVGNVQPGLTGGSEDTYVRHLLIRARKLGWRVVVFNSRGCGHSPVTTPKVIFCFALEPDLIFCKKKK